MGHKVRMLSQGIIQPSLWVDKNDTMKAFFRSSRGLGHIYMSYLDVNSWSDNDYDDWTDPVPTTFPNPNSGVDTVYYDDSLFLVYNPSETNRYPLVINRFDENVGVQDELIIQDKVGNGKILTNELSYPYMIERDGKLHVTYTYGRTKIEYVVVDLNETN